MKDNIGVIAYGINQSTTTQPNYTTIAATTRATSSYTASAAGTYVIWVKDVAGRIATASFTISQNLFCAFNPNQAWNFDYTGGVQSFTVPCSGTYKLEVWGAQGGNTIDTIGNASSYIGGTGGYANGNLNLMANSNLYVVVGGSGINATPDMVSESNPTISLIGGYNGGGSGSVIMRTQDTYNIFTNGSGGGATHIATTDHGVLSNYESFKSEVLIVAGGGGGAGFMYDKNGNGAITNAAGIGGTGGGYIGGDGTDLYYNSPNYGHGGTQSTGGTGPHNNGGFGYGGSFGGGGGYYGGGGTANHVGSGGGSGYIGGVTNGSMQNGVREGNGYARITLISIN